MNKEEDLKSFKQLIQKEKSLSNICDKLKLNEFEVMGLAAELKKRGHNVLEIKRSGETFIVDYGDNFISNDRVFKIYNNDRKIRLAFISDTRLGSKFQQLSILNDIYIKAKEYGVTDVFHCGDISEGEYTGRKKIYTDTLFVQGAIEQGKYIVQNYPYVKGINTHFIIGDHDITHLSKEKIDIGKFISNKREDMEYIGKENGMVLINSDEGQVLSIRALHPKGKIPYTISYKPQQFISAMRNEDKTDILLNGHWLQAERMTQRNISEYSVPSVVSTTPEMIANGDQNEIGAWFLTINLNKNGTIKNTVPTFIPYYKTIDEDYKTTKVFKFGGIK